ncbi:ABC transporter substrate-binding protein [Georgenia sp. 10Sc9-8]|uniref:ABC transporter substrate-binding protein n=1 Tax=Georgenia halotolerans TaxID=3028317 RepID=A0ABT5TWY3_9MICO|nr:ABC transporter substrate-binding protein [Georgenia halotolerans]
MSTTRPTPARRTAVRAAAAGAALLTLAACTTADEASDEAATDEATATEDGCPVEVNEDITTEVQIAFQPIPNGDLVVRDQEWLEECMPNATIQWNQFASGAEAVQAFGSGTADLGLVGSSPATKAISPPLNIDMQVVWIHDVIGDAESLVALGDAETIEDLDGATIAVPYASTAHFSLLNALSDAGLDPSSDVNLINLSPDAMLGAWEREEIDAAWVWNPTLQELLETGTAIMSSEDTAAAGTPTYDMAAATRSFIESNPEFMTLWTELQDQAVQMIQDEPEQAAEAIGAQLGIDPAEAASQMEGYVYLRASEQAGEDYFGGTLNQDLATTAEFLLDQQEITEVSPPEVYADAVYSEAITQVAE